MFGPLPIVPWSFDLPERVETDSFVLRLLTLDHFHLDFEAYMSSVEHLQRTFNLDGVPFGVDAEGKPVQLEVDYERWPANSDVEFGLIGAAWCHFEWKYFRSSFTYGIAEPDERRHLGCAYVFPCYKEGYDVLCQSWVRADAYERGFDDEFHAWFKPWVEETWPFDPDRIGWPGRTIPWEQWNALPDQPRFVAVQEAEREHRRRLGLA